MKDTFANKSLAQIKQLAEREANNLQIEWDHIDADPAYAADMEQSFQSVLRSVRDLEELWHVLTTNKKIGRPGLPSTLSTKDRVASIKLIADELFAAYTVIDLADRYHAIRALTAVA